MTNLESFKNTRTWIQSIYKVLKASDIPKIMVGNKLDLVDERKVDTATAQSTADEYGINYFETSAQSGEGIQEMMDNIMKHVYEYKIVPEKLNPPAPEEKPRDQSFSLAGPRKTIDKKEQKEEKPAGCCK